MSSEKVANQKIVGNFLPMLADIKFVPKGLWKLILEPSYCGSSDGVLGFRKLVT
jgi:hypothetical protein